MDIWGPDRDLLPFWTTVPRTPSRSPCLLGTWEGCGPCPPGGWGVGRGRGSPLRFPSERDGGVGGWEGAGGCDAQTRRLTRVPDPLGLPPLCHPQYSRQGPEWAPLQLSVSWECGSEATRVSVDYRYNASALASAVALTNVQVLLPIEEPVANVQPQPKACW